MWQGIQPVTNYRRSTDPREATLPDSLNTIYQQVENRHTLTGTLSPRGHCLPGDTRTGPESSEEVEPHKTGGPVGAFPRLLKACGEQIAGLFADKVGL